MVKGSSFSKASLLATALVVLFSLLLTACGGGNNNNAASPSASASATPAPSSSTPASPEATPAASLPEVKLTWYIPGTWPQADSEEVFAELNKLIKEKINATVNFIPLAFGEFDAKMKVVIASGEEYDLTYTANWLNNYYQNVAKGAFLPLDELLAAYAPQSFANVSKSFWDAALVNGKIYGFINDQIAARTPAVTVTQSLADKYGLDIKAVTGKLNPSGLRALEPFLEALHKGEPQRIPFITSLMQYNEATQYEAIAGFNIPGVVSYDDPTLTVINQFETPEIQEFAAIMRDWNAKGYLGSKERISMTTDKFDPVREGLKINGAYKPGIEVSSSTKNQENTFVVPAGTAHLSTGGIIATMTAISRTSKNPERAMMLLELMNTDKEVYTLLNFGIKDKHYVLDADGFKSPGPNIDAYNPNAPWAFATNYLAYVDKGMPATVWEDTKKVNAEAIPSRLLGFSFDAEPVKTEVGKVSAVFSEYARSIELGVATEAKYNEFVAKMKEAGSETIIAEMQKQINAWAAAK